MSTMKVTRRPSSWGGGVVRAPALLVGLRRVTAVYSALDTGRTGWQQAVRKGSDVWLVGVFSGQSQYCWRRGRRLGVGALNRGWHKAYFESQLPACPSQPTYCCACISLDVYTSNPCSALGKKRHKHSTSNPQADRLTWTLFSAARHLTSPHLAAPTAFWLVQGSRGTRRPVRRRVGAGGFDSAEPRRHEAAGALLQEQA